MNTLIRAFDGDGLAANEQRAEHLARSIRRGGFQCEVRPLPGQTNTFQAAGVWMNQEDAEVYLAGRLEDLASRLETHIRNVCGNHRDLSPYTEKLVETMRQDIGGEEPGIWESAHIDFVMLRQIVRGIETEETLGVLSDRSGVREDTLLKAAQTGRLMARQSGGIWLSTLTAVEWAIQQGRIREPQA